MVGYHPPVIVAEKIPCGLPIAGGRESAKICDQSRRIWNLPAVMASSAPDLSRFIAALTRHQPALEAFCHAQLANRQDAQEALQSTCVKLWEKSAEWNPETEFLPWAFAVARFTVLSHIRDRMRDRLVFDEEVMLAMADETERAAAQFEDRREALGACLQKLKPEQRDLLQEHYIAGRSIRELSTATGRSESAVKMILLRLREQLSACINLQLQHSS
ncbi:MAG: sigma-70 family RNA polymerase sigma factor [Prosthecobacter sp.]|uniref:sigma-70 family RNA polymerase sigma factor n=1 Tax=Prosthecobacter sp. TaxID=1965333 RepID=UPI003903B762